MPDEDRVDGMNSLSSPPADGADDPAFEGIRRKIFDQADESRPSWAFKPVSESVALQVT